jgi:predicted NAD/FAD-dependent oxidoreductase
MPRIAIIGAGPAGLAAGQRLSVVRPDLAVVVWEKSRGLGGRAATRRRGEFVFDHGAQYVKAPTPELRALLDDPALVDIGQPVWLLDGDGAIQPGDAAQNAEAKWTYADGLARLGRKLAAGLDVRLQARVGWLAEAGRRWELFDSDGGGLGQFDAVLLTPPAPQLRDLIAVSQLAERSRLLIDQALAAAVYRRCLTITLGYEHPIERPWYALINSDRRHPLAWLAREHAKPGRAPRGSSLLIAQIAPVWSQAQWDTALPLLAASVHAMISSILAEPLPPPVLADRQGWRFALPAAAAGAQLHNAAPGLFWAGDYLAGQGRVHRAIEAGWAAAERIAGWLA